jgi:hypothetical protein
VSRNNIFEPIESRFLTELNCCSRDWQWFVDWVEKNLDPCLKFEKFSDFYECFSREIEPVFTRFVKILNRVDEVEMNIEACWLRKVYKSALVSRGLCHPSKMEKINEFYGALEMCSYITFLTNKLSGGQADYDFRILNIHNFFKIFDFKSLSADCDTLLQMVSAVSIPEFDQAAQTLKDNLECIPKFVDDQHVSQLLDEYFDADFFSGKLCENVEWCATWEEKLICSAFTAMLRDGKLETLWSSGQQFFTEDCLNEAKKSLKDPRAICVIESIQFLKFEGEPSLQSQEILVQLCIGRAKEVVANYSPGHSLAELKSTAFVIVNKLRLSESLCGEVKGKFFKGMKEAVKDVKDYLGVSFLESLDLPLCNQQKNVLLKEVKFAIKNSLADVKSAQGLLEFLDNKQFSIKCDEADFKAIYELVQEYSISSCFAAAIFYEAMQFFIKAHNNTFVNKYIIKQYIINLRKMWRDKYYQEGLSKTQNFVTNSACERDKVKAYNEVFGENPWMLAREIFKHASNCKVILHNLFGLYSVSEYYPKKLEVDYEIYKNNNGDSIDGMIFNDFRKCRVENNALFEDSKEQELLSYVRNLNNTIELFFALVEIRPIYKWIESNISAQYILLPYLESGLTLGHLTQLFPILENAIRDIGEKFCIVPFQIDSKKYVRLREISAVLNNIISEIESGKYSWKDSSAFKLIYYIMYSANGFNVRNDCIHGRQYQNGFDIDRAFRLTLICLYMMLKTPVFLSDNDKELAS